MQNNKNSTSIFDCKESSSNLHFADEDKEDFELKNKSFSKCKFESIGIKRLKAQNSSFFACIFDNCYFRKGEFTNVDFTGSLFINCNFDKSNFHSCTFKYVRFQNCLINRKEILASLPSEPNLRTQVLISLKQNALQMGYKDDCDLFLMEELRSKKQRLLEIFRSESSYYKNEFGIEDRIHACWELFRLNFEGFFWGHGISLARLIRTGILFIFIMGSLIYFVANAFYVYPDNKISSLSYFQALHYATSSMLETSSGPIIPASSLAKVFHFMLSIFGPTLLGFFVAALYRRISR